jgi:hypothetical protein
MRGTLAPWEMFNLKEDPLEEQDLAQKNRKQFAEMGAAMRLQMQRGGAVPWQKGE